MIKVTAFVLISLLLIVLIKDVNKEFALILSLAAGIFLFSFIADDFFNIAKKIMNLSSKIDSVNGYASLMFKILGISLISQFVVDLCHDSGENALASQTETASKIIILISAIPLFETIISIVTGLLK